jgi:hypothetical protein
MFKHTEKEGAYQAAQCFPISQHFDGQHRPLDKPASWHRDAVLETEGVQGACRGYLVLVAKLSLGLAS